MLLSYGNICAIKVFRLDCYHVRRARTKNGKWNCQKWWRRTVEEGGGRVRCRHHLPPHRYIRNTFTRGTAPIEHPLNAGRRPQTSQKARNSPRTWVGQKKKEKTETKNRDGICTSGRELWRRKGFLTLGRPLRAETVGGGGGKLQSHGGERSNRGAEGKVERFLHRG